MKKNLFRLFALSILISPSIAFASADAGVIINNVFTSLKTSENPTSLSLISISNDSPQELDLRRIQIQNTKDLSFSAFSELSLISRGAVISDRFVVSDSINEETGEFENSTVEFWLNDLVLKSGEAVSLDLRGILISGKEGLEYLPTVKNISIKTPYADLVRDIELSVASGGNLASVELDFGTYAPVESDKSFLGLPDLYIEEARFDELYGYMKDVFVIPVCNKGFSPTPEGARIEASVYIGTVVRDFSIRNSIEEGKCFEYVLSAKRDLRVNENGSHEVRVELDQQNIVEEERENNNSRLDTVVIEKDVNTNSVSVSALDEAEREDVLSRARERRARAVGVTSSFAEPSSTYVRRYTSSGIGLRRPVVTEEELAAEDDYYIHPSYGDISQRRSQATEIKETLQNVAENDIVRDELPVETVTDQWEAQAWERENGVKGVQRTSRRFSMQTREPRSVSAPSQVVDTTRRPTFKEPNQIHEKRVSFRALRSGVRTDADFEGLRSNNLPEFEIKTDLSAYCVDSDGLNFFEKGTVTYKSIRMVVEKTAVDQNRGPYVLEYYCEGDYMRRNLFECEESGDGACVQ